MKKREEEETGGGTGLGQDLIDFLRGEGEEWVSLGSCGSREFLKIRVYGSLIKRFIYVTRRMCNITCERYGHLKLDRRVTNYVQSVNILCKLQTSYLVTLVLDMSISPSQESKNQ